MRRFTRLAVPLALLTTIGCQPTPTKPADPVLAPVPVAPAVTMTATTLAAPVASLLPQRFAGAGIRFSYPAGWVAQPLPSTGSALLRATAPEGSIVLTLDVPSLPPHIPGWIPVGLVASGYADDVQKRLSDATGPTPAAVTLPGARARRVSLAGHDAAGHPATDDAVVVVHGDRVYILSVDADPAGRPAAVVALDAAVASVEWDR